MFHFHQPHRLSVRATAWVSAAVLLLNVQAGAQTLQASLSQLKQAAISRVASKPVTALSSVAVSGPDVIGGQKLVGTVTLTAPATANISVALKYRDANASSGASVVVLAGHSTATFSISTVAVPTTQVEVVTATLNGVSKAAGFNILELGITQLALSPPKVVGGNPVTGTITLSKAAPAAGVVVTLLTNNATFAKLPTSVKVLAGATSATFTITTVPAPADKLVTIDAKNSGLLLSAPLTVQTPQLTSVSFASTSVAIAQKVNTTFTITGKAPSVGTVLTLASTPPSVLLNPVHVTIPAGATAVTVPIQAGAPFLTTQVILRATLHTTVKGASIKVTGVPGSIFPLITGKAWTYEYSDTQGGASTPTLTCMGPASLMGVPGVKFSFGTGDDYYYTLSSLGLLESGEVHSAEAQPTQPYVPPLIMIAPSTTKGYTWSQTHVHDFYKPNGTLGTEEDLTETGTIVGVEPIVVPIAAYPASLHVRIKTVQTNGTYTSTRDSWYVPNVGKVKEILVEPTITRTYLLKAYH